MGIFSQYLKLREQVHITQGVCWHEKRLKGRPSRSTNISAIGKILGVNEKKKKKKAVQEGIWRRSSISEARKEVLIESNTAENSNRMRNSTKTSYVIFHMVSVTFARSSCL